MKLKRSALISLANRYDVNGARYNSSCQYFRRHVKNDFKNLETKDEDTTVIPHFYYKSIHNTVYGSAIFSCHKANEFGIWNWHQKILKIRSLTLHKLSYHRKYHHCFQPQTRKGTYEYGSISRLLPLLRRIRQRQLLLWQLWSWGRFRFRRWRPLRTWRSTFHTSWMCFFCSWWVWFSMAPLLLRIRASTKVTALEIWTSNMASVVES